MSASRRAFLAAAGALAGHGARRSVLGAAAGAAWLAGPVATAQPVSRSRLFDCHCHIIDHRFPIVPNQGYVPPHFPLEVYRTRATLLGIEGGAVVSGSFHGFDQTYLKAALAKLGNGWVGVTQVPNDFPDKDMAELEGIGVRALRFNLFRGRVDSVDDLVSLARRAHSAAGWHAEIYADAASLAPHVAALSKLPRIVIDHLGMTEAGLPALLDLVRAGAKVKATGFGRVKMDVASAIERIAKVNPAALMFGSDLPSTRAERPFQIEDITLIERVLGRDLAGKIYWDNAVELYRPPGADLEMCL